MSHKITRHKVAKLIKLKHQHYTGKQLREIRAKKGVGRPLKDMEILNES